ncbi:hypothetical protein IFR05_007036 [Cadophora sp. M221]|nr:hypothetical protein IFR05_007036 [Cadophora sp. M221]
MRLETFSTPCQGYFIFRLDDFPCLKSPPYAMCTKTNFEMHQQPHTSDTRSHGVYATANGLPARSANPFRDSSCTPLLGTISSVPSFIRLCRAPAIYFGGNMQLWANQTCPSRLNNGGGQMFTWDIAQQATAQNQAVIPFFYEIVPAFEDGWIEFLGDLDRYRMTIRKR